MRKWAFSYNELAGEVLVIALILSVALIYFFPIAFDPVPNDHYTWVNFHFMSIMQNTNKANGFVGYSYLYTDGSSNSPRYFNRYSPLTDIVLHYAFAGLSLIKKTAAVKVFFSLVFLGNCICIYLIGRFAGLERIIATSLMLIIASQYYFLYPKDMVHFDQMALFGLFVQILLIMKRREVAFFWFTIIALHLGRSFMLILTSFCFYSCRSIRQKDINYLFMFIVHLLSFFLTFGYNVAVEMKITGASFFETSILNTFERRTGILPDPQLAPADWQFYAQKIVERIGNGVILNMYMPRTAKYIGVAVSVTIITIICLQYKHFWRNCALLSVVVPAFIFFSLSKRLIFFHDYTMMWLIPMFAYVISEGIVRGKDWLTRMSWRGPYPGSLKISILFLSSVYFGTALYRDQAWKEHEHSNGVIQTIQSQANQVNNGAHVCMKDINHYSLNALLPGAIYTEHDCDFLLSATGVSAVQREY